MSNGVQQSDDTDGLKWTKYLAVTSVAVIIVGFILTFLFRTFAILPFSVVVMGILVFFGILRISRALQSNNGDRGQAEMRKAITVSIVVVYLGLLPTLAFQGIIQFQAAANTTAINILNQTAVNTVPQVSLSETVVTSFTALVTAVILFYFGSRTLENIKSQNGKNENGTTSAASTNNPLDNIKKSKELLTSGAITQEDYDKLKNQYIEKL